MTILLITAELPENTARLLAEKLMDGEHPLPICAAGAFEGPPPLWRFEAWSTKAIDKAEFLKVTKRFLGAKNVPNFRYARVSGQDWIAKSLQDLPPVRAGRFCIFGAHDHDHGRANEICLQIEASLAFGTGHHPTTLGCLLEIDRWCKKERASHFQNLPRHAPAVLDIGTGTGILALAAAKALPLKVLAGDIDADAIAVASRHGRIAGLNSRAAFLKANGTRHPLIRHHAPFPLVFANILAEPLVHMARDFACVTARAGTLILSGLLTWQAQRVIAAYLAQGFMLKKRRIIGDWATLVLNRR